jgi:hypothetical protein
MKLLESRSNSRAAARQQPINGGFLRRCAEPAGSIVEPHRYLDGFGRPVNPDETPPDWQPPEAA